MNEDASRLAAGSRVGEYEIEREVGAGATGTVYRARDLRDGAAVALKVLHPEAAANEVIVRRLRREARAAMAIDHPGIVRILGQLERDGAPVLVMEYLEGESLQQMLDRRGAIPLAELAPIALQVASAVGAAHALGIVHRDLKPENILLRWDGYGMSVKVLDFGVAKLTASEGAVAESVALTRQGMLLGTPFYMSPEQALGESTIDYRADLWAMGVILYRGLTGVLPTEGRTFAEVFQRVVLARITPIAELCPELPTDIAELVMSMVARKREDRPQDLRGVYLAFARVASQSHGRA